MATVFRRSWTRAGVTRTSPWYSYSYTGADGRKVTRQTSPPTTSAKEARQQLTAAMAAGVPTDKSRLVWDVLEAYARHLQVHSPSHWRRLGKYVCLKWRRQVGTLKVEAFSVRDVDKVIAGLKMQGRAPSTLAAHLVFLKAAFRFSRQGHPVASIRNPYRAAERHVVWTDEELAAVAARLPGWARGVLGVLRTTGLRVGDAVALRWDEVGEDVLHLRQEKTGAHLDIPLSAAARTVLDEVGRRGDSPWVFPARPGGPRLVSTFRRTFMAACRAAGVAGRTIHDVRRTYATRLWNAGVPPHLVARLLGQRSTSLVWRYTHTEMDVLRAAITTASTG